MCDSLRPTAALLPVLVALAACDRDEPPPPDRGAPGAARAPVASVAKALGIDAGEVEPSVDPPAAAGDLKAELDAFSTIDACVDQRAHLDPLLGDALEAIGYDTFVRDACRVLDAAKAKDTGRCAAIDASSLRHRCEATVAAVAGNADACPFTLPTRPEEGRDPFCLAVASRDPRLCAAQETSAERTTCDATVRHDPAACGKLPLRADQARCRRDEERWHNVVLPSPEGSAAPALAALPPAEGTLHLETDGGAGVETTTNLDTSLVSDLSRGIVLLEQRDGARMSLGSALVSGSSFVAASPHTQATFSAEIFAGEGGKRATATRITLSVPGHAPLATPLARSSLAVTIDKLEHTRGGTVSLSIEGDLGDSTGTFHVRVRARTFVRDVVSAKAAYELGAGGGGAGPLRTFAGGFGDAGAMR